MKRRYHNRSGSFHGLLVILFMLIFPSAPMMLGAGWCADKSIYAKSGGMIRIALIHLDSRPGEIARNRRNIEAAINQAVAAKADWVLTPELAETGYGFARKIGTDWIENFPSQWILSLAAGAHRNSVALFIGMAERDSTTGKQHNSVAVIDKNGVIQGTYRKHRVVNGPAERWAAPGIENSIFTIDGVPVAFLICADSYKNDISSRHKLMGAQILLSPANWPPAGEMGPKGYWEERSRETGLPLIVNNRTGVEPDLDFSAGESAAIANGKRLYTFVSATSQLVLLDWNRASGTITPAGTVNLNE
jgi:predicted amidohydrolase